MLFHLTFVHLMKLRPREHKKKTFLEVWLYVSGRVQVFLHLGGTSSFLHSSQKRSLALYSLPLWAGGVGGGRQEKDGAYRNGHVFCSLFLPPLLPGAFWSPTWSALSVGSWSVMAFRWAAFINLVTLGWLSPSCCTLQAQTQWLLGPTPSCHQPVYQVGFWVKLLYRAEKTLKSLWLFFWTILRVLPQQL